MAKRHVTTTVNGDDVEFLCSTEQTLLDVLRDELYLTGSKEGCASGDCGACSVMLDGRLVCACLVLGVEAEGHQVETIEGMADGDELHPLQQKFLDHAALQCGICTPGILVASKALLEINPIRLPVGYGRLKMSISVSRSYRTKNVFGSTNASLT